MSDDDRALGAGPVAMLVALPFALAVDFATLVLLERGLSVRRSLSIAVALVVTVVAWALIGGVVLAVTRRRADRENVA